jgi:hypothetical protein
LWMPLGDSEGGVFGGRRVAQQHLNRDLCPAWYFLLGSDGLRERIYSTLAATQRP